MSLRPRRPHAALAVLLLAGIVALWWTGGSVPGSFSAGPSTTPTTVVPSVPSSSTTIAQTVTFAIDDDVPVAAEKQIRQGVEVAQRFAEANALSLSAPIVVVAHNSRTGSVVPPAGATAVTTGNVITVYAGSPSWMNALVPAANVKVVAHEYFHVIQHQFHSAPFSTMGPQWLVEGAAEYFGVSAIVDQGIVDRGTAYRFLRFSGWSSVAQVAPLDQFETVAQWRASINLPTYDLAYAAVDRLVQDHGGFANLTRYFEQFGSSNAAEWHDAFRAGFGLSSDEFYAEISQLRT